MNGDYGCGCGGNGSGLAAVTDVAAPGVGFARPSFFGGMLLTEDDLQAAIDYTVAKRKLTNRYVIGTGVVCGLEVKQDVCDPRSVIVSPGYAIDCCGNDILVSCPETVDIIDLVRELRQREGVDCGEPCEEQPRDTYELRIRYVETPTSPVAPYAPDDCATGECEFSRVSEGYTFELACDESEPPESLIDRLRKCKPDDEQVKWQTENAIRAIDTFDKQKAIMRRLEGHAAVAAVKAPSTAALNKVIAETEDPETPVDLDHGVELVTKTLAAHADASVPSRPQEVRPVPQAVLAKTRVLAERLCDSEELKAKPPAEQERIKRLLTTAVEQPDMSDIGPVDRAWLREGMAPGTADETFAIQAEGVRVSVLRQLADRGETGTEEYRALSATKFRSLSTSGSDLARLGAMLLRLARGCVCDAFNPPCPTCTDNTVAIAAVRVDACEVVDICELDRHWIMSPRAIAYWYPVVEAARERLERLCCGDKREPVPDTGRGTGNPYEIAEGATRSVAMRMKTISVDEASQQRIIELERKLDEVTRKLDAIEVEKGAPR